MAVILTLTHSIILLLSLCMWRLHRFHYRARECTLNTLFSIVKVIVVVLCCLNFALSDSLLAVILSPRLLHFLPVDVVFNY